MRNKIILFCLMIALSQIAFGQNNIVPIVIDNDLIGGTQNGKWFNVEQVEKTIKKNTEFDVFNAADFKGQGKLFGTLSGQDEACGFIHLFFSPKTLAQLPSPESINYDSQLRPKLAIGANAKWNLFPRTPKNLNKTDKVHTKIITDFLKAKGISKTKIVITDALGIDLEGDGTEEIILSATYFKDTENIDSIVTAGDYSFSIVRKLIKGKALDILLEGEFFTQSGQIALDRVYFEMYPSIESPAIYGVADLNGDGVLEIVAQGVGIFVLENNKAEKVLSAYPCIN